MKDIKAAQPWTELNSGVIREPIRPDQLGHAELSPKGDFTAGSHASFTLTYTAGLFGIDDSGSLRICFRFAADQDTPQFTDPAGANYCTVEASNGAVLQVRWDPKANVRPWDRTLWIKVVKGYLTEGDTITIRFGVTDHGGPGMRLQTFCEDTFEFRVLVDPIATFNFQTLPEQPVISIVPGDPVRYLAVAPTLRRPGQAFTLKIKGEDRWGNPSDRCDVTLYPEGPGIDGLPDKIRLAPGAFAAEVDGLSMAVSGQTTITLRDDAGAVVARTNPILIESRADIHFWGDLHGQSEETIGTGSARQYFAFARDRAFVDATGHQGNDFQITDEFWDELNRLTAEFDEPGRFVVLPGYEWSGNTSLGGDRNVFFPTEGRTIRRSSHALIPDTAGAETDCSTARELFQAFDAAGESDVVMFAHCGGRYADIGYAHDGRIEKSVEVHSSWGSFEWLLHDALDLGYRVGVVTNSDGHKGRPGASYPGSGKFGAIGGLSCYVMPELTREGLLDCLRKRHHYGSTGGPNGRLRIDFGAEFEGPATLYHDDPALGPAAGATATQAIMGDIVHLPEGGARIAVSVSAGCGIERVDLFDGKTLLETVRPYDEADLGSRIRVLWEGAEYRGRFREVIWDGDAVFDGASIRKAQAINFFNPDKTLDRDGTDRLSWTALTTGNFGGFDVWLNEGPESRIALKTPLIEADIGLEDIGIEDVTFDASGELPRFIKVSRLPANPLPTECSFERDLDLNGEGDRAIYVRVTLEDGTRAWTSPIYFFR